MSAELDIVHPERVLAAASNPSTSFAVRDGDLTTGRQQDSGTAAARPVIDALGT